MNDQEPKSFENVIVPPGKSWDDLGGVSKVLKILANHDALAIFCMSKDGIEADTSTHSRIGFTKKQYYTRLMQLKRVHLIEKKENLYYQTTMGSFLYQNCLNAVQHAISNRKKMTMIDILRSQGRFSEEDLLQMESVVSRMPLRD